MEKNLLESTILEHLSDPDFDASQLSNLLNCSYSKILRFCQQNFHSSPGNLIKQKRLEKAKYLLSDPNRHVREIMFEVGMQNKSYFARSFRREFGISPSEYQKSMFN